MLFFDKSIKIVIFVTTISTEIILITESYEVAL